MSEERERTDRFEHAVDRAVRDLLNVEPPAGLRSRVLQRIEGDSAASAFRRKIPSAWLVLPLAAAAVLILAVMVPWRPRTVAPAATKTASVELPAAPAAEKPPATVREVPPSPNSTTPRVARPQVPRQRTVTAAIAAVNAIDAADANVTTIEPLAGPAAIAIGRLPGPPAPAMSSIEPAPMHVEALEIPALPQTPRERREE